MNWADLVILVIVAISALISLWRGFTREALSLASWIAAILVALGFADALAPRFEAYIETPSIRLIVAFAALFLATLLVGGLINYLVSTLVRKTGLSGTDRMLGVIFGVARGVAIVGILVLLAGLTPLPQDPWWKESVLIGHAQQLALWIKTFLPPDWQQNIVY